MALVTVKKKFQVVIPLQVRRQVGIEVGDLLEAKAERGKVSLIPKSAIDRGIAESLEDFKKGRFIGPFSSAKEAMKALRAKARK
ncbi:MAG: AbrB/MazE/SpoVT family DNA-binding domain-containing protein [Acidobacteria bacterium]|nr:AbrB/MazE/SpoVT family DNA-binding domain-containing protein [Acidobacteriota bacterium]